jgi:hypothetical protein
MERRMFVDVELKGRKGPRVPRYHVVETSMFQRFSISVAEREWRGVGRTVVDEPVASPQRPSDVPSHLRCIVYTLHETSPDYRPVAESARRIP